MLLIFFQGGSGLCDLLLGSGTGFVRGQAAGLVGLLAARFLILEYLLAGFTEALFVFGGTGFGRGDVGARFFHGSLGTAAALGQDGGQRAVDQERIKDVEAR